MAFRDRKVIPLPFGEGLQRSVGRMIVQPNTFDDLRNVYQYDGKAQSRGGMTLTDVLVDDIGGDLDITVALGPLRVENAAIGVGYDSGSREIWVNRLATDGTNATNVGLFNPLALTATYDPPIIILADTDSLCFLAHAEPNYTSRLPTKIYDPMAFPFLVTLTGSFGAGNQPIHFSGVTRHLSYIFGWGFGGGGDVNRPELVRVSTAGDPTEFRDEAFFEVGQRGEPVMVARSAGQFLMVFKETETHQIFGYSPDTFGVRPSDSLFGCVGNRLAVSVAGSVFFWSVQGPRVTNGGESIDLAVPLDLDGPDPATLAAESNVEDAFAEYDPSTRVVSFVWGQRVYALSIRDPNRPRWSYYELAETAQCGGQFFVTQSTGGGGAQPADGPDFNVPPAPTINPDSLTLNWDNVGATGGETVEIWQRLSPAGVWAIAEQPLSNLSASQSQIITGLVPDTAYDFSMRYRRGGLYNPSAVSLPPDTWPAVAQTTETTTLDVPIPQERGENNGTWQVYAASDERIRVDWTIPAGHETLMIEVERRIRTEGLPVVQDVDGRGIGPPDSGTGTVVGFTLIDTLAAGTTFYEDSALTPHRWHDYRFRFVGGVAYSTELDCWAGPDAPQDNSLEITGIPESPLAFAEWVFTVWSGDPLRSACPGPSVAPAGHSTEGYYNDMVADPAGDNYKNMFLGAAPFVFFKDFIVDPPAADSTPFRGAVRHQVTCFGTVYPSYWSKKTGSPNYDTFVAGMSIL